MDGIPTVFMEAMAIGRPVVSCGISGIPELVRPDETGLLVPQNDARAVAMAILRLARDDRLRIRLGQQARALIEQQHDNRFTTRRLLQTISAAANPVRESGGSRVDAPCNQFSQDSDVEKTVA
jgi:glycosyltransferase involved in cell wall biosynthesis